MVKTASVKSLSCLHVAEHIGIGRDGDPLDPKGTIKAAHQLTGILAPDRNLYLSLPVGKPKPASTHTESTRLRNVLVYKIIFIIMGAK